MYTQAAIPCDDGTSTDTVELFWDRELGIWATNISHDDRMTVSQTVCLIEMGLLAVDV